MLSPVVTPAVLAFALQARSLWRPTPGQLDEADVTSTTGSWPQALGITECGQQEHLVIVGIRLPLDLEGLAFPIEGDASRFSKRIV